MMAGKHMSATHVAGSNTKFMGNGGQHAIATGAAAHLCNKYATTPRGVYEKYLRELQTITTDITGTNMIVEGREGRLGQNGSGQSEVEVDSRSKAKL